MKKLHNQTDANTDASDILANLFNSDEKTYDLSEWNMWQSSNQERYLVTKSKKSEIFCDILQKTSVLKNESVNMTEVRIFRNSVRAS